MESVVVDVVITRTVKNIYRPCHSLKTPLTIAVWRRCVRMRSWTTHLHQQDIVTIFLYFDDIRSVSVLPPNNLKHNQSRARARYLRQRAY